MVLRSFSIPYSLAMTARNYAFDRGWKKIHRASVPIISVGNLTVGGTGKTPIVEFFASRFLSRDVRVGLLSRGYGSKSGPNDEARLLRENLPEVPHLQGKDRSRLVEQAVSICGSELVILDDGFQHRRLNRDLDVVLIDAADPWGGGWTLPGGLLRESINGLRRAHLAILTRTNLVDAVRIRELRDAVRKIAPTVAWAETQFVPTLLRFANGEETLVSTLDGQRIAAFCGIGNPESFRQSLSRAGAEIIFFSPLPDHCRYDSALLATLEKQTTQSGADYTITTQKDMVKIDSSKWRGPPLASLRQRVEILHGAQTITELIEPLIARVQQNRTREIANSSDKSQSSR